MPTSTSSMRRKGKGKAPAEKITATLPLGKQLAHTDKAVRDHAIQNLAAFVSRGGDDQASSSGYVPLVESEMAKLWKGLFYCFWMSDKPLVQQALATDMANLLLLIDPTSSDSAEDRLSAALSFLDGFWKAIVREWTGIDRLRMDKFYMLIRRYVNATFRLLARHEWSTKAVESVNNILAGPSGPMDCQDRSISASISTHIADIYLEELDKVLALPEVNAQPPCPLVLLLRPHIAILSRTTTSNVHARFMSSVFSPLLSALTVGSSNVDEDSQRPLKRNRSDQPVYPHIILGSCTSSASTQASIQELKADLLSALFRSAADPAANEVDRRKIYQVWREQGGDDEED